MFMLHELNYRYPVHNDKNVDYVHILIFSCKNVPRISKQII